MAVEHSVGRIMQHARAGEWTAWDVDESQQSRLFGLQGLGSGFMS